MSSDPAASFQSGSVSIHSNPSARRNASQSRSDVCENCSQRPSAESPTIKRNHERAVRDLAIGVDGCRGGERVGVALGDDRDEPVPGVVRGDRLHQRGLDPLAAPARLALVERGEDAVQRELRGGERAVRHRRERGAGPLADGRERVERTDLGQDDAFVALEVRVRTGSAERGDRRVDQAAGCAGASES